MTKQTLLIAEHINEIEVLVKRLIDSGEVDLALNATTEMLTTVREMSYFTKANSRRRMQQRAIAR